MRYHGSAKERAQLRPKLAQLHRVQGNGVAPAQCYPIVLASYEMILMDRRFLRKFLWNFIVVDEGHRIKVRAGRRRVTVRVSYAPSMPVSHTRAYCAAKNLNCRLIRELKACQSANRLLLTGTPLQNNLSELWSLLNFLLPDIFDDLDSFQEVRMALHAACRCTRWPVA